MSLEQKSLDPRTSDYASKWQAKALEIKSLSDGLSNYIENIQAELKTKAGLKIEDGREVFDEDDNDAVRYLFNERGYGKELYYRLGNYEHNMLAVDSEICNQFKQIFISSIRTYPEQNKFIKTFFSNIPTIGALAMLSKFENDTKIMENEFVSYCHNRSSPVIYDHSEFHIAPLITQSSYNLLPGQKMDITAGIGSYSTIMKPVISINGMQIKPNDDGVVQYSFTAPAKTGKHSVDVIIRYTKPDGTAATMTKTLEYFVGFPQ